jgi:predicted transcriptional regulator
MTVRVTWYILVYMKQLLIEIDEEMATRLERVAPTRSRRRSDFIRDAIRRALWELEERATAQAYARQPDSVREAYLDATVWEAGQRSRPRRQRRR